MKNFPFQHNNKEYWYSRSIVCTNYIFCKYLGEWWVLAAQRGSYQSHPGKWNVPGGFLDHGETTKQCVMRETFEETGVDVADYNLKLYDIDDEPKTGKQHVVFSYYTNLGTVKSLPNTSNVNNEPDETMNIKWIPVYNIRKFHWIPGQLINILDIYNHHINRSTIKYWLKDYLVKLISKL